MKEAIPFTKAATSIDEQVNILRSRGLAFPSAEAKLCNMLLHNNYYRLEGYWFRYYDPASYPYHEFQPGTSFERILADYQGDAELRHCTFRLPEVIEISFRSIFAYTLAKKYGPFPFSMDNLACTYDSFVSAYSRLLEDTKHSKDEFMKSFAARYTDPIPPVWMIVELMTMGEISRWYGDYLTKSDRKKISGHYGLQAPVLESWLRSMSMLRNRCAHHNRLYGITVSGGFMIPKHIGNKGYLPLFNTIDRHGLYNLFMAMCYLADVIERSDEKEKFIRNLISIKGKYGISEGMLGLPEGISIQSLTDYMDI